MNAPIRRHLKRGACLATAALAASLLQGCVHTTPDWDLRFGDATRIALAQQISQPEAARNADPVAGMDGRAARAAFERYQKSFSSPAPQTTAFTIGVSAGK